MNIKMVVVDLDDTLLCRDKTVSEYTQNVLCRCRETGIKTVIATGRGHPEAVAPIELFDGVIANNGANIFDGDFQLQRCIPYAEARPLLLACHKKGLQIALNFKGMHYTNFDSSQVWPHIKDFEIVDFAHHALDSEKICIEGITPEDAVFVEQHLTNDIYLKVARDGLGMVMHHKATKSAAVTELAERWNITQNEIAAFGDDLNDIDMLTFAGIGIAVDNALDEVKAVVDYICDDCDNYGVAKWLEEFLLDSNENRQQLFIVRDSSVINVLDETLYSYDNAVFALSTDMRERASYYLLRKIEQFIDSVPTIRKAADYTKIKTEYTPLISDEFKKLLQEGMAEIIPCKSNSDAFYLQIRSKVKGLLVNGKKYGMNRKIKDIPLGTRTIPVDIAAATHCLSMQSQLNQIANGLYEISKACEFNFGRLIQGQRDDRIAKLLSSRSCYIQALAITDANLQRQMLIQAIRDANSARAELAFQIKSDISLLGGTKVPKAEDMAKIVRDINTAVIAMNNAVQSGQRFAHRAKAIPIHRVPFRFQRN